MPHMSNNCSNITAALVPEAPRAAASSSSPLNYDAVVILAAMVCALACVLGLNSMLQCVALCARRAVADTAGGWAARRRAADAGLKGEDVAALPVSTYVSSPPPASRAAGCAICLSEFADGERIRELPVCGHRFHVACITKWLVSHCSCPTCRRRLSAESSVVGGQRHLQVLTAV
ncbi:unnamed protein product [Urochloa decumbens]|uniref:RING-type domain-containing protein n=1 Tax=Urochloa decumbens TaxID=240449 RepID=A0ABC9E1K0_9POAL